MNKLKVCNLFAGPAAGKSTIAAGLFYHMKINGYSVELVTEYAKDLYYDGTLLSSNNDKQQLDIFLEQYHRIDRLQGKVEWAIIDSPLLLSYVYAPNADWLDKNVKPTFDLYDNYNFFLNRPHPDNVKFQQYGRAHNYQQSLKLDQDIKDVLRFVNVKYCEIGVGNDTIHTIIRYLNTTMNNNKD